MGFLLKVLLLQIVVLGIIGLVLRFLFEKELWKASLEYLIKWRNNDEVKVDVFIVKTAKKIDSYRRESVNKIILSKSKDIRVEFDVDEKLKGGVQFIIDGCCVDYSVATRLKALWKK